MLWDKIARLIAAAIDGCEGGWVLDLLEEVGERVARAWAVSHRRAGAVIIVVVDGAPAGRNGRKTNEEPATHGRKLPISKHVCNHW